MIPLHFSWAVIFGDARAPGRPRTPIKREPQGQEDVAGGGGEGPTKRRRITRKGPDVSMKSFESRLLGWAEKCLAFQSSGRAWLPAKPCCPASLFLGQAAAPRQVRGENATACVQRLSADQLSEMRSFFQAHPYHFLFQDGPGHGVLELSEQASEPDPNSSGEASDTFQGSECRKLWPWMRDLPPRLWAGHGWLMEEGSSRKLKSTGGGAASKGLEVFESTGAAPESRGGASQTVRLQGQSSGLERRSGIQNISWFATKSCWRLQYWTETKRIEMKFHVMPFMEQGLDEDAAMEAALREAKAAREELVRQGKLGAPKPPKPKLPKRTTVKGVYFYKSTQQWRAKLMNPATNMVVHGGYFATVEEAEAKAWELAAELGIRDVQPSEAKPLRRLSELRRFEPLGPQLGVTWSMGEQCWRGAIGMGKAQRHMRFRPKDFSNEEVQRTWNEAVVWRQQQEKERDKAKQL